MSKPVSPVPTSRTTVLAAAASALLVLAAASAEAQVPRTPRSLQPTPAPGSLQSGQADLVPILDTSSVVRFMKTEQVRVSPDGRVEFKHVVPSSYCSGLAAGASRQVRLPDFRFGVKNEVPRSVAGIPVAAVKTPFLAFFDLRGGFVTNERVESIGPGETKMFTAARRENATIQVTLFEVPARVRPTPVPTPSSSGGGTTSVRHNPPPNPSQMGNDMAQSKCVASVFVEDALIHVSIDPDSAVKETNENNNVKVH